MGIYSQPRYTGREFVPYGFALDAGVSGGTTINVTDRWARLPNYIRRHRIEAMRLRVTTPPNAAATNLVFHLMNGTNTFGTAVVTTATTGQLINVTITNKANTLFAKNTQPSLKVTGTATGASDALGMYDIWVQHSEEWDEGT